MATEIALGKALPADQDQTAGTGFGKYGWIMILFSVLMYFAYAGWIADGINIISPAFARKNGWDEAKLLSLVAPGGILGVVGYVRARPVRAETPDTVPLEDTVATMPGKQAVQL